MTLLVCLWLAVFFLYIIRFLQRVYRTPIIKDRHNDNLQEAPKAHEHPNPVPKMAVT